LGDLLVQISTPERAILETLYLVPHRQSIEEAWLLMEGLVSLRPRLLQVCNPIKMRRLFLYLAEKHQDGYRFASVGKVVYNISCIGKTFV
jgi:Transcriptional regulator, AbiEi antitoxin, Type IV TA system